MPINPSPRPLPPLPRSAGIKEARETGTQTSLRTLRNFTLSFWTFFPCVWVLVQVGNCSIFHLLCCACCACCALFHSALWTFFPCVWVLVQVGGSRVFVPPAAALCLLLLGNAAARPTRCHGVWLCVLACCCCAHVALTAPRLGLQLHLLA